MLRSKKIYLAVCTLFLFQENNAIIRLNFLKSKRIMIATAATAAYLVHKLKKSSFLDQNTETCPEETLLTRTQILIAFLKLFDVNAGTTPLEQYIDNFTKIYPNIAYIECYLPEYDIRHFSIKYNDTKVEEISFTKPESITPQKDVDSTERLPETVLKFIRDTGTPTNIFSNGADKYNVVNAGKFGFWFCKEETSKVYCLSPDILYRILIQATKKEDDK